MARPKLLFVSPGTGARSLIAKGFARYYAGQAIELESACPNPKPPSAYIIWAMNEVGVDISEDRPLRLRSVNLDDFDYVATISNRGEIPLPALKSKTHVEHWTIADTASIRGQTPDVIRSIRVIRYLIETKVQELLQKALTTA